MRVRLIAPPYLPVPPHGYGGTESVVDLLARGLVAAGHEVHLVASGDSSCPVPLTSVHPAATTGSMGALRPELEQVTAAYQLDDGADVVHDHTLLGPLLAARGDVPAVVTIHGALDPLVRAHFEGVHHEVGLIAISRDQAATAPGLRLAAVIHHGIDVDSYPCGRGRGGYLLFLGRMSPEKGVVRAIEVAERSGLRLLIAARCCGAEEEEYFRRVVRPRLGRNITYLGEVDADGKRRLLGDAAALVNPVRWHEPFGLVMVEALASGTPVLGSRWGSVPEIVRDGVTGAVGGTDELVRAALDVGRYDREACRSHARANFSTARMVADHVALYQRWAEAGGRDRRSRPPVPA